MGDTDRGVMDECGKMEYSPKPQDEKNIAIGMMYISMVEMAKAR